MAGEGEAVRMEWGPYSSCWGPGMRRLRTEGRLQDVTLVSMDRQNFPAHKVALAIRSEFFSSLFSQSNTTTVYMHGFPGALLSHLVAFMYEGEATVKEEMIEQFLDMGKELKIEGLYDKEEHSETLEEAAEKEPSDLEVLKTDNSAARKKVKKTVKVKTIKSLEARARASGGRKSSLVSSEGSSLGHVLTPGDIQKEDGKLGNPDCEMTEKILQKKKAKMQKNLVSVLKRFESRPDENLVLGTTSTKGSAIANGQEIGTDGEPDESEHLIRTVKEIEALICIKEDNIGTFNQLMAKLIKRPGGNIIRCAICGKEFKTKQNALNHVEAKHISDVVHECKVCQQCLKTRASLEHHNRNVH